MLETCAMGHAAYPGTTVFSRVPASKNGHVAGLHRLFLMHVSSDDFCHGISVGNSSCCVLVYKSYLFASHQTTFLYSLLLFIRSACGVCSLQAHGKCLMLTIWLVTANKSHILYLKR
jgi:hypothetical protein